ncbi:P-loop NTPase family protein [Thermococcus barossii]|uniref:Uncharacterized protein n=1 Tax=Thermococcus barossii TaxID=54077 RepID=A0A2Z2MTR8_9EURY|nr:hypothetical protein [Thermococcus barossii]ASJ05681.1 hypothetical protein A3L01_10020 [Thermococcus barossii]
MSIWGWIALVAFIVMAVEGISGRGIRESRSKLVRMCYTVSYSLVMIIVMIGVLIGFEVISKNSLVIWIMPVSAILALILTFVGISIDNKKTSFNEKAFH